MMDENWIVPDKLCCFGDKVRVENGPQVVDLVCNDKNLHDEVTAPHYRVGGRDAFGRLIRPVELIADASIDTRALEAAVARDKVAGIPQIKLGDQMSCVDYRCKHKPFAWKVYVLQETGELDHLGEPVSRFIKVDEIVGRDEALARGRELSGGDK